MRKKIIITGGASGLGLEIAKTALDRGYDVGVIDTDKAAIKLAEDQNKGLRGGIRETRKAGIPKWGKYTQCM